MPNIARDDGRKGRAAPNGVDAVSRYWNWIRQVGGLWLTRSGGMGEVIAAEQRRFHALVQHARRLSPFYRRLYRGMRGARSSITDLPVLTKKALMAEFDDWATDRKIRRESIDSFLADRDRIGTRYLGRYWVWKSSGTSGEEGIFVHDAEALSVYDALIGSQLRGAELAGPYIWGMCAEGGRAALVTATGDHYASIVTFRRAIARNPWLPALSLSVTDPVPRLVAALNEFQPASLASYPTMLALLAEERRAGRLRIAPTTLWAGGEHVSLRTQRSIETAFAAPLQVEYGASEALSIAFGCREGWLHVNSDWVILEAVDRDGTPTRPGQLSHTTLLTNLANRLQPLIRYDLGDRITVKPEPCACGNSLPAIRVEGRIDDLLVFPARAGTTVTVLPMAISTVVEEAANVHDFQVAQVEPSRILVRLRIPDPAERDVAWGRIRTALRGYFREREIERIDIGLDAVGPILSPRSGKLRSVVDERRH